MRVFASLGLLIGMIVGAGMFALPYVIAQGGIFWGSIHFLLAFFVLTLLHLLYGEINYVTPQKHRLPGYARYYFGDYVGRIATFSMIFGFFGALLAYGVLAGIFLEQLLGIAEAAKLSLFFFIFASPILFLDIKKAGDVNLFFTIPLILFIIMFGVIAYPHINFSGFSFAGDTNWFLPYGIFLFAFSGAAAIPEISEIFQRKNASLFRKTIFLGTLIPAILYLIFIISVVGVSGFATSKDAISGLAPFLGSSAIRLGAAIGFFAVFTSYLALGLDLREMFHYDYRFGRMRAWMVVAFLPLFLFLFGVSDFISIIGTVGGVAIGIDAILILFLALHVRKTCKPPFRFLPIGRLFPRLLMLLFFLGSVWQLATSFGFL